MKTFFKVVTLYTMVLLLVMTQNVVAAAADGREHFAGAGRLAPAPAPAASKDLRLDEMLTCTSPAEAHQKSKAFMDAHISNLKEYVEYLSAPEIPPKAKYDSLLLRYGRFLPARPSSAEMGLRVNMLLGTLEADLEIWKTKQNLFMEITSEGYAYNPENDLTALDILYIKMFVATVSDAMAEAGERLFCSKLTYEEIDRYVAQKEKVMGEKASDEEPFDFIYSWNLARMLRPFLSPIYLHMERMDLYKSLYNQGAEKPASCVFVPNDLYAYVSNSLKDIIEWLNPILKGVHKESAEAFVDKVNAFAGMPFGEQYLQFRSYRIKMTGALKKGGKKIVEADVKRGKEVGFLDAGGEVILWHKGKGSFATGYKYWMDLLQEMSLFMGSIKAEEDRASAAAGAGTSAHTASKAKASKGKKLSKQEQAAAEEAAFLEAEAENAAATKKAAAEELKAITLRLVEAQQSVARNWEQDLERFTHSLRTYAALDRAAPMTHTADLREWAQGIVAADMIHYQRDCEAMLKRHFILKNRGGSRIGLMDRVSKAMGFFDAPHATDEGHRDKGALWRKSLQGFFERAGLYPAEGAKIAE
jgi:hypothetical protein